MAATLVALAVLLFASSPIQQPAPSAHTYSVSGRIVDGSTGKPMAGAVAILWERSSSRADGKHATTGTNGTFEFAGVSPGLYQIGPSMPGLSLPYRTETIDIEIRDTDVGGLGLIITPLGPRAVSVTGKVVMDTGGPVPGSISRVIANGESSPIQSGGTFQVQLRAGEKYRLRLEDLPLGVYIKSLSAGSWDTASETLAFTSTPPANLQVTLAIGARTVRGRVVDRTGAAAGPETSIMLSFLSGPAALREVPISRDGTFEITRLRAGSYELKARKGSGASTQTATLPLVLGNQDRAGVEIVLKPLTRQKGRVVIEGAGRLEDLQRFRPVIEITDILGTQRVPLTVDGTFEFQSFEGEYAAVIRDLPVGYDPSITTAGSTVEVKLRVIQGDVFPGFRLLQPR